MDDKRKTIEGHMVLKGIIARPDLILKPAGIEALKALCAEYASLLEEVAELRKRLEWQPIDNAPVHTPVICKIEDMVNSGIRYAVLRKIFDEWTDDGAPLAHQFFPIGWREVE